MEHFVAGLTLHDNEVGLAGGALEHNLAALAAAERGAALDENRAAVGRTGAGGVTTREGEAAAVEGRGAGPGVAGLNGECAAGGVGGAGLDIDGAVGAVAEAEVGVRRGRADTDAAGRGVDIEDGGGAGGVLDLKRSSGVDG